MTLETLIAAAVEKGVAAALSKYQTIAIPVVETVTTTEAAPEKKPRAKKTETAPETPAAPAEASTPAAPAEIVTTAPLPPPAAPSPVPCGDLEADRAKLIALTGKITDGRKIATDMIKCHGPKFDGLPADVRAAILEDLEALANEQAGA